ncbi:MAG: valyl-tRNA synthetase [Luteibaculaceae bacterium]|jgi:valyl-tRNA synthetase
MEIASKYDPKKSEDKWYSFWMENNFFKSVPDEREPYTVVIPPPNVTGVLHMGHMLNNTIQDVLVRKARMEGKNACWVPGTDHASIATEAKVVAKLKEEGIAKSDLTRPEFLEHAWEWKEKHGGIILEQLKKLGASCDWDRTSFTMDPEYSKSVIDTFIDLFNKGLIYRGVRMVNWDPGALTALSDEEVIHKELQGKLYYLKYKVVGSDEFMVVATTRPETILGDTAVCVNPTDARYQHLVGKQVEIPGVGRHVNVIADAYVDIEFGTGCLKITPAHDINDYELGIKHNLESIDILNDNGTLNDKGGAYAGMDRFDVRKKIVVDLKGLGLIEKMEDYTNKVGCSERSGAVIEPKLSLQWFLKMEDLSKPALENVMNDEIQFHPKKFKNSYKHWMENVKDWCLSRQLWWGHQIPAWYYGTGISDFVVATTIEEATTLAATKTGKPEADLTMRQDEDVLDTWFSSWLWPISVFDGFSKQEEIDYYYPTNDIVTAPEIMFFWVARMAIAGYEYKNERPFKNVYYTGIVRDPQGRKMSKSLGNSPDPLDLIGKHGADGVRVGMLLSSPAGNDLLFDEALCEQGRNFSNKIWNAFRLVNSWEIDASISQPESSNIALKWFEARFNECLGSIENEFAQFRISEALMASYKLVWDDFCSWFLEFVKPAYQSPIDAETYAGVVSAFERILRVLHPFMPFITEEIWHLIGDRKSPSEALVVGEWPKVEAKDDAVLAMVSNAQEIITQIRNVRKANNLPNKEQLVLKVRNHTLNGERSIVAKMANLSDIETVTEKEDQAFSFIQGGVEYYIPFGDTIDVEAEKAKMEEELKYTQGFLMSVSKKLSNEKFVSGAPEQVVANEQKKKADAEQKISMLQEKLASM